MQQKTCLVANTKRSGTGVDEKEADAYDIFMEQLGRFKKRIATTCVYFKK